VASLAPEQVRRAATDRYRTRYAPEVAVQVAGRRVKILHLVIRMLVHQAYAQPERLHDGAKVVGAGNRVVVVVGVVDARCRGRATERYRIGILAHLVVEL